MAEKPAADDQEQTGEPSDEQEEAFLSPPDGKPGFRYFLDHIIPAALPYYDPIKVLDPCVGSGVMLLAVASQFPRWATHYNLVQFYGMDIDQTCVRMANINMMVYCLNSYGILMEEAGYYAIQALQLRQEAEKLASSLDRTRLEPKTGPATAGEYHQNGHGPTPSKTLPPEFTFESLFKRVASSIPVSAGNELVAS
jgi:hypothetical protein